MKSFRAIWLLACLLLAAHATFAQKLNKQQRNDLKKASQYLEYEEYQNAIPHIRNLLAADSQNPTYNYWMGVCLFKTYLKNQALPHFQLVEKTNPEVDVEFHHYYAYVLHYNLMYDRAIEEYHLDMERFEPTSNDYLALSNRVSQCLYAKAAIEQPESKEVVITNMGEAINTEFAEHSPVISADNQTLIFTARRPESLGADPEVSYYDEDIYVSKQDGGKWSKAVNIGLPVNSKGHDATISLTADGETLYLYRHKKDGGLYRTDYDDNTKKWREPSPMQKPLNSKYYEASVCQSADSSLLFFTSARPGGLGGLDIYMCQRTEQNTWSEPKNLGLRINSKFNEDAPYFHPDGKTLYYSSDGPKGYGGYDIFVTEYDAATGTFSEPVNMGRPVNSPDDEIYFVLSGDGLHGYYTSGMEGGRGEKDIYEITFPNPAYPRRAYKIEVVGTVQDANTLDTLSSTVRLVDRSSGKARDSVAYTPAMGVYRFELEPQRAYSLEVSAPGYNSGLETVESPVADEADVRLERNIFLNQPAAAAVVEVPTRLEKPIIEHIYFDFDKHDLRDVSKQELDMALQMLQDDPTLRVEVEGHTDWFGTYDYNVRLSEQRTKSATGYLRAHGVESKRIVERWLSESRPIESNEDDRGRQFNRHCELRLMDKQGKVVLASIPTRPGGAEPWVDHTTPKGQPGFDYPGSTDAGELLKCDSVSILTASVAETPLSETKPRAAEVPTFELRHLYFDFDRSHVRTSEADKLDRLAQWLQAHPDQTVRVMGHTDAMGDLAYNAALSDRRCQSAIAYLQGKGVSTDRIAFVGHSETMPLADNGYAAGRQANRRVEIEVVSKGQVISRSQP